MKRLILIIVLFLPALAFAQPSINFENETKDFGEAAQGSLLEHTFTLKNTGTEDLLIERLKAP